MNENNLIKKVVGGFKSVIVSLFKDDDTKADENKLMKIINGVAIVINGLSACIFLNSDTELITQIALIIFPIIATVLFPSILGAVLIINAVIMAILENISMGTWITLVLGAVLVIVGIFNKKLVTLKPKALFITMIILFWVGYSFFSFLYVFGSIDNISYKEDALIVLGCGVKGDEPGTNLTERLECAIEYHEKNPDAIIVVSGGKGDDENVSEAEAMKKYLTERGVPTEIIIKEDKATSTEENFLYSKEILDKYFDEEYKVAFITNDFHIYRSTTFAKLTGFANTTHAHSNTTWYTVVPNGLRECITVLKLWVLDQHKY